MQKHNQQYHSHLSLNRLPTTNDTNDTISKPKSNLLQNKPFRSEMNLMLSFEGDQPKITPLESTSQDSPPPTLPNPMILLPPTLPYTGFEEDLTRPEKPSPLEPVELKENGFALIRRRLFNKKTTNIPQENPKIVVEKPPLSELKRNDSHSSSSEQNPEVNLWNWIRSQWNN